ncbi:hypothetical protein ACE1CD_17670 [Aerosakkonema sp. BLCC-F183]|uniref:hypothetical protein n=1 Tax=Aerosakkonema sp. BLCC-F183 TaxID=3342834 RepID=UPI0035B6D582
MTQTPDNRLDRIERVLDNLVTNQLNERDARLAQREDLEILYQTIQQIGEGVNANREAISEMREAISEMREAISEMKESEQNMQSAVSNLTVTMLQFAQNAEADRAAMRQMQAEIQQIWQYLLSQRSNGSSGSS